MASYFVAAEAEPTGEHVVHQSGCNAMPTERRYIGEFWSCQAALDAARKYFKAVNGCAVCSPACHRKASSAARD